MPIAFPDILIHNNGIDPLVDSNEIKGGTRSAVADLAALYALAPIASRLKEYSTKVYVISEAAFYLLTDDTNIGNSGGWTLDTASSYSIWVSGVTPTGTINGINNIFYLPDVPILGSELIYVRGFKMYKGAGKDYQMSSNQIIFESGSLPEGDDWIDASYFK